MPSWLDAAVVVAGLAGMVALIVAGALRVVRSAKTLSRRLERFGSLPPQLEGELELAEARVAIAQLTISTVPALVKRAQRALASIARSRTQLQQSAATAGAVGRFLLDLTAPRPGGGRSKPPG